MSLKESHPRLFVLYVVLNIILVVALPFGFWLEFHPPTVRSAVTPQSETSGTPAPQKPVDVPPANPQAIPKTPKKPTIQKTPNPAVANQGGNGNQQTTTQSPIIQANNGDCNQQVVGGNNNTQNCIPPPRTVNVQKVRDAISSEPGVLFVLWEDGTPDSHRVAQQLANALLPQWHIGTVMTKMGDPEAFPFGVTLSVSPDSTPEVLALVGSLKNALNAQGIECGATPKNGGTPNVVWVAVAGK